MSTPRRRDGSGRPESGRGGPRRDAGGGSRPVRGQGGGRPRRDGDSARPRRDGDSARPRRDGDSARPRSDSAAGRPSREQSGAHRSGRPDARTERSRPRDTERAADSQYPPVPESADPQLLDRGVRAELRSLSKPNADAVAKYLVTAGELLDSDPALALAHARAARARAARVAAVREAVGIAAYHAGEWAEALSELRAARRMSGDPRNLAVIADVERALGRPEQAARMLSDADVKRLDAETRVELLIVVAGARRDLGQHDAALSVLARGGLDRDRPRPGAARLWYAYADTLATLGRTEEAASWFAASAALDPEGELDAAERAADLL